jgi:hypothetical protein
MTPEFTWSLPLYTNRELCCEDTKEPETEFKNIYWIAWGFTWELIPQRIYEAYKSRECRVIPIEDLPDENQPLTLLRLDTQNMTIADSFQFPYGYFVSSIQFILALSLYLKVLSYPVMVTLLALY